MILSAEVERYLRLGAASGETDRENRASLDRWRLMPRVLRDVSSVDTSTTLLGRRVEAPIVVAPMAAQRLAHHDGEMAVATAAAASGIPMVLSLSSTTPVEDVAGVDGLDLWFQVYPFSDPAETRAVIDRALIAGARVVVLTVDMPPLEGAASPGREIRLPPGVDYAHHAASPSMCSTFVWDDLSELVRHTSVPVVVKGLLHPDDVHRARALGADGVVISNHGGRVHDGLIGAVDALARLRAGGVSPDTALLAGTATMVDGAISSGIDVVRSLALGADAALVGRPVLWALAADGERGVREVLGRYRSETANAMAVIGSGDVGSIGPDHVVRRLDLGGGQ